MPNNLTYESSPYLLQHADNPVEWYPWGEEALARARQEDKPIFLSIGYAACHWCHVMAHESFEDQRTARIMNDHFINIKVDREERPDLDGIYMQAVVAMTGQGGWPMSVFLTPDLQPFYGGTYFPHVRRYNMPGFSELLLRVAELWREERHELIESAGRITGHLGQSLGASSGDQDFTTSDLEQAALLLAQGYDWKSGGWGKAPKFPQPMALEFLLRRASAGDPTSRDVALHCLEAMQAGGMYDVVGGGFARYSTDDRWLVPHFEKMLYDNAQLALVYLHGFQVSDTPVLRQTCERTLDFMLRELCSPEGGFYASLDADSEGGEGAFYTWTLDEIRAVLDDPPLAIAAYGITEQGNFEGKNILQRTLNDQALAAALGLPATDIPQALAEVHNTLLAIRSKRPRPTTDDKILTAWNGLALLALAEAARYLRRQDYLAAAQKTGHFLLENMIVDGRLMRAWRLGQAHHKAYLEDYAALILGLLALYETDPQARWYQAAASLAREMIVLFHEPGAGFFDTGRDHEALLLRPRDLWDNATPCGSSQASRALLHLSLVSGHGDWRDLAEESLAAVRAMTLRYPTGMANWLTAADFATNPVQEVAILGEPDDPRRAALETALWGVWRPHLVAAISTYPPEPGGPALLNGRYLLEDNPAAYVCQHFYCQQPVSHPEALAALLRGS